MILSFPKICFYGCFVFLLVSSRQGYCLWLLISNLIILVTPIFMWAAGKWKQWNFSRSCKGGKYEYDSLLSTATTWNRARFRKHSKQSNAKALKSLSIHYRKVSWVLSQFALVFKESVKKFGYLVSLPNQLEKMNQKGKKNRLTGGTLTRLRKWSLSEREKMGGWQGATAQHSDPQQPATSQWRQAVLPV